MNVNYTYNNKYQQPSFLQSMLYGAVGALGSMGGFGSLTGLGGCFGGGVMNMGMGMGMGGSLFNMCNPGMNFGMGMYGMGGFGCCDTSDRAVFSAIGTTLGSFGVGALVQKLTNKKTNTTPGSTINTETKPKKSDAEYTTEAKNQVNTKKPELKTAVDTANKAVEIATAQTKIISENQNKISGIEAAKNGIKEPQKPDDYDNNQTSKQQYDEALKKYNNTIKELNGKINEAEEAINNAKIELATANITDVNVMNDTPEKIVNAANKMLEKANKAYDDAVEAEVQELQKADGDTTTDTDNKDGNKGKENPQVTPSAQDCIDALNKVDGNFVTRAIDGKDSGNDQLDDIKDAISRFENNPSKVTKKDIEQLMKFTTTNEIKNDDREDTKAALKKVKTWINSNKDDIKLLNTVLSGSNVKNKELDTLVTKGFCKKFDTNVSGTKKTVYKIGDKVFEKGANGAIELSKNKNGNILHKAEYSEKKNNATT